MKSNEKGLHKTYGRGVGEKKYHGIPMSKRRPRFKSALYDLAHVAYPQTGAYAAEDQIGG